MGKENKIRSKSRRENHKRSRLKDWIVGICRVSCSERDMLRLLNILSHHNIHVWQRPEGEGGSGTGNFYVHMRDRRRLCSIAEKCGITTEICLSYGIADRIRRSRRLVSVLAGLALLALLVYAESLYVWHIEVCGSESYTDEEIIDMISMEYPCYGRKKSDIDTEELRDMLVDNFEEICWASCGISGTKLTVYIKESIDVFTDASGDEPCNIVASMDCSIYSAVTSSGTPVAANGDDVKKGDILISGAVSICNDSSEVVDTVYVAADGEVFGITELPYSDSISRNYYKKRVTDERLSGIKLGVGKRVFTIFEGGGEGEGLDTESETVYLHIGDFYLPVFYTIERGRLYDVETLTYTDEELSELANRHLQAYIAKLREKGVQIQQKNVIIACGGGGVTASGSITALLSVGVPEKIDVHAAKDGDEAESGHVPE